MYESREDDSLLDADNGIEFRAATNKKVTWPLSLTMSACVIGTSFQFGYSTGVLNAPQHSIEKFLNTTSVHRNGHPLSENTIRLLWSLIVSIWCVGGMIGGFSAGFLIDRFGRKKVMLVNNLPIIASSLLMGFSKSVPSYEMLIAGRFLMGIGCGICSGVAPVYLSEVAPLSIRGAAGVLNQFTVVLAVLLSQVLGLEYLLGSSTEWPYLLAGQIVPAVIQLLLLPWCPESPRYLLLKLGMRDQAEQVLLWLRRTGNVEGDLQEMLQEQEAEKHQEKVTICDLFRTPFLRWPLVICVIMMLSQQLSGINAVIYYSTSIFEDSGMSLSAAQYATLGTAGVNVAMTFVSAILMDRAGRRTLHLHGLAVMFLCATFLTISFLWKTMWHPFSYVSILAAMGFVVGFAIGPGSIPWFFVAELFSQASRGPAASIAVLVNWMANFSVGLLFPTMQTHLQNYSFVPFMVLLAIFWVFVYLKVPETKNKTIEEITAKFKSDTYKNLYPQAEGYQRLSADEAHNSDM